MLLSCCGAHMVFCISSPLLGRVKEQKQTQTFEQEFRVKNSISLPHGLGALLGGAKLVCMRIGGGTYWAFGSVNSLLLSFCGWP